MEPEDRDLHLSRLASWVVQTVGAALLWSTLVAFAVLVMAASTGEYELAWWAVVLAPLVFGLKLTLASAPLPPLEAEEV
ncbi:FtsH-binding integral membrane protein [Nocardioides salarius]|uniref:FtsH-binding integral membrane protein n=1 Tax=Nocardioides salarius TaxID=374513 RepID=A0ABS2MC01_9ACTN|nr:hypothetical protein [Nocardioides salarius]MBM7508713.1 FtsH-binding integral membrane protein [Nocardioides salarius]